MDLDMMCEGKREIKDPFQGFVLSHRKDDNS